MAAAAAIARALEAGAVVVINHPVGGRRVPVFVFALAERAGFLFVEDGAFDPMYFGHPFHIIEGAGEAIAPGRWRFGEVLVEVIGEDDLLYRPALRARRWLESISATSEAARERAMEAASDDLQVKLVGGGGQ